jgi:uncharacterized repeat protein (TIGR03803 family)
MAHAEQSWSSGIARLAGMTGFLIVLVTAIVMQGQTFQVIHAFSGTGGDTYEPLAGLSMDGAGNLYGTTYFGGDHGNGSGSVFKLSPKGAGWVYTPLHIFHYGTNDGADPGARAIFGPDGSLYGTTVYGGTYGNGTIYRLRPPAKACVTALCPWTVELLYSFNGGYGWDANGIVFDPAGNIYGTTSQGGDAYKGVIYKLAPSNGSWVYMMLYDFAGNNGGAPFAGPTLDQAGNIYGTTFNKVYEFTTAGDYQVLHQFTGYDTSSELIFDAAGNLYGTTFGTVFELSPSSGSWTLNTLYTFTGGGGHCDGTLSSSSLSMDAAGNLYGTTFCAGAYGWGNVFKLSPSNGGWVYTSLHDFCAGGYPCSDGNRPWSNVVIDSKGNLYGTTSEGAASGDGLEGGVVWEITP